MPYLSADMIERQASLDLLNYVKISKKPIKYPIYPDEIVQVLWGVEMEYPEHIEDAGGEEVLARFLPDKKLIQVNSSPALRGTEGRLSFTIAHEAGHVSLHNFLAAIEREKIELCRSSDAGTIIEWQADKYAAALLMPQEAVWQAILELECINEDKVIDLRIHAKNLMAYFKVSRAALENRLFGMGIAITNTLATHKPKKSQIDADSEDREAWQLDGRKLKVFE